MRARHPDLFSDTRVDTVYRLPRSVFEFHLDTLTSRKQEYDFEHFCRKIAEKEICTNLRPQTGPLGGGDSKVDTESYPVAEEIAERWWTGTTSATRERWAFAFSAKKKWKPKAQADVRRIASTGRDYKKIYFFTNQAVPDRQRASVEDSLSEELQIPVVIIDRTWIVDKVYQNGHLKTAIATLGLDDFRSETMDVLGPRDSQKLADLRELDKQIADPSRYQNAKYLLVNDCLESSILARNLEHPQSEVSARFAQTSHLAEQVNNHNQLIRVEYQRAWTAYWWYEDYTTYRQFYTRVEGLVQESNEVREVELLMNLWLILLPRVEAGDIKMDSDELIQKERTLRVLLENIACDESRPNNALEARWKMIQMDVITSVRANGVDDSDHYWSDLEKLIDESDGLVSFPTVQLFEQLSEITRSVDSPALDSLYDKMVNIIAKRRSEEQRGELYARRGSEKLERDKPYEAIEWFGRAEGLLLKDECAYELIMCLLGSSYAYERAGLLWAAYNKVMGAVEKVVSIFVAEGSMPYLASVAAERLVWIELQIGRIPKILAAIVVAEFVSSHTTESPHRRDLRGKEIALQDLTLGKNILNIPFDALPRITRLPDVLARMQLPYGRAAALFVLGQFEQLRLDNPHWSGDSDEAIHKRFGEWQNSHSNEDLSSSPALADEESSEFTSVLLGSRLVIITDNQPVTHVVSESILGCLEGLLATSKYGEVVPFRECATIRCSSSNENLRIPRLEAMNASSCAFTIVCPSKIDFSTVRDQRAYLEWVRNSAFRILNEMFVFPDSGKWITEVTRDEGVLRRALIPGNLLTVSDTVFGRERRLRLESWFVDGDRHYDVRRTSHWRRITARGRSPASGDRVDAEAEWERPDREDIKHSDQRVVSPIDIPLWDRARWRGALFSRARGRPPELALLFQHRDAGLQIFQRWIDRVGKEDREDWLRIAIIRGVSVANPAAYSLIVGPNTLTQGFAGPKLLLGLSRILRVDARNSANLENFLSSYRNVGRFLLMPAFLRDPLGEVRPESAPHLGILIRNIVVRDAWTIDQDDLDLMGIFDDDCPVIPASISDAPIHRGLAWIKNIRGRDVP